MGTVTYIRESFMGPTGRMYIPGRKIYGEEWHLRIRDDKIRDKVYICEAHEGLRMPRFCNKR
jgi:hypothetical protein